jgi:hypothetical protein
MALEFTYGIFARKDALTVIKDCLCFVVDIF